LLLGFFSWAVSELLAGFAAYADAVYSPPASKALVPIETQATDTPRGAKPSLNLMMMQVNGSAGCSNQIRPSARIAALPAEWRGHGATAHGLPCFAHTDRRRLVVEHAPGGRKATGHRGVASS
jgi:hypothetical protein